MSDDGSGPSASLRRVVLGSMGVRAANVLLGAVAGVVIARALAPEGRGAYAVVVTVAGAAVAVSHLSVEQAQIGMWKDASLRPALRANAFLLSSLLGLLGAGVALAVVDLLGPDRVPVYDRTGLLIALAVVPAALLGLFGNGLCALSSRVDRLNLGMLLAGVLQTGALLLLALAGRLSVTGVIVVWALTTCVPPLVALPVLAPRARDVSWSVAWRELTRGVRFHAGVALLFLLFRVDLLILNGMRSPEEVGLYALAVTLAELVYLLSDSVAQAIVSRQAGAGVDATRVTGLAIRVTFVGGGIVVLALALTGPALLPWVYGADFRDSVPPLLVLLPGVLAFAAGRPVAALLAAREKPGIVAALSGGAFALNVVLVLVLVPPWGIVGAAAASTIAYLALCAGYLVAGRRVLGFSWAEFRPRGDELRAITNPRRPRS